MVVGFFGLLVIAQTVLDIVHGSSSDGTLKAPQAALPSGLTDEQESEVVDLIYEHKEESE